MSKTNEIEVTNALNKALEHLTNNILKYRKLKDLTDGATLNFLLKEISGTLFYLENIRANIHDQFQNKIHLLVTQGESVSRAENTAHKEFPEMYLLRRIMDSAYTVIDSIRTNISFLKSEYSQSTRTN